MNHTGSLLATVILAWLFSCATGNAQSEAPPRDQQGQGIYYNDSRGNRVFFPLGERSFADQVVWFQQGTPAATGAWYARAAAALGPPRYVEGQGLDTDPDVVNLGCGGRLTLRFTDNGFADVAGPDLYVFEVGKDIEPTDLEISIDGREWVHVGRISGATAAVDIAGAARPGEIYHYVRLTDLKEFCEGYFPGAEIDAVGAIGGSFLFSIGGTVLFDYDRAKLSTAGRKVLDSIAGSLRSYSNARIIISGHTDSIASEDYNLRLSKSRAEAVRSWLSSKPWLKNFVIESVGYGESRPIAANDTEEDRQKNRRVEINVVPLAQ
jgi:outer membrane protein OmpA-like peptidoglycan-associated protein